MKPILLVTFQQWSQTRLPYQLLLRQLKSLGPRRVVAFKSVRLGYSRFPNHSLGSKNLSSEDRAAVEFYEAHLGVEEFIQPRTNRWLQTIGAIRLSRPMRAALNSPTQLENLSVCGVLVGDLIYDAYCTHRGIPTPEINSRDLRRFLAEASYLVRFWDRYFRKNSVAAVVGETVYLQGIPLRVAQKYGVPVFVANLKGLERIDRQNPFEDSLYRHYPELAKLLPAEQLKSGMQNAEESLRRLLRGEQVDRINLYSGPSPFAQGGETIRLPDDGRDSVLIVPHDFFDSSHSKGLHLYPDFYVWLWRLGELSRNVNLNWWLKPHPRESDRTLRIFNDFFAEFPHIRELPGRVNPLTLESLRIKAALTVRGTVAGEYPLIGIPVINASTSNMHFRYRFSLTPATREEYESLVVKLDNTNLVSRTEGLSEFFYLRHILEYAGTFLSPEEIASRTWDSYTDVLEIWEQVEGDERTRIEARVRDFIFSGAHWMRGSLLIGLERSGHLWLDSGGKD